MTVLQPQFAAILLYRLCVTSRVYVAHHDAAGASYRRMTLMVKEEMADLCRCKMAILSLGALRP